MSPGASPAATAATNRLARGHPDSVDGSTVHRLGAGPSARSSAPAMLSVVHEFTAAWERGESPSLESYLGRLDPDDDQGAVDLIYREYCLAEADGRAPVADSYAARFPRHAEALRGLFQFHGACSPSLLDRLMGSPTSSAGIGLDALTWDLPEAGDSVGPYRLRRELGRGSFARVFLAEQVDLSDRLVVVKIAARSTREPWLLARARHAHIVEILSHAEVDDGDLQLIAMPFWGGATLADVLAESSSRSADDRRRAPATGSDLLAALDAVAAPEYPSVHPARPAREILAPLSYARSIAWVVARLAEALDHAAGRDVAHGDVKPTNILLSADGSPMLLDFNLARDGAPAVDPSGRPIDPGGTLAYMAPERLRALAAACSPIRPDDDPPPPADERSATQAAHVADLYSMGMVLLEALTGRPPTEAAPAGRRGSERVPRAARLASQAGAYAVARERPSRAVVADFEAASGRPIAPAMRTILGRCLDPDPDRRYRRALELAEDLDRWRTDRPLAYADEPFWGQAVPRWLRVRRRKLTIAAACILAVGLGAIAAAQVASNRILVRERAATAAGKLALRWDAPGSPAFLGNHRSSLPRFWSPDDARHSEDARLALLDYGVIADDDTHDLGDWRERDDVRYLPPPDRDDLEVWLMERAYRYARTLADRPGSAGDRRRAVYVLDRAAGRWSIAAFAALRDRLAAPPGAGDAPRAEPTAPAPAWLDEHLLGFAAECRTGDGPDDAPAGPAAGELDREGRATLERALAHYGRAVAIRPGSFWGHYRAASACFGLRREEAAPADGGAWDPDGNYCFGLGRESEAARHLAHCLERRPDNTEVQGQLAGRLIALGQYPEALNYCDRGLERAPRFAELYRTRAFARAASGQTDGVKDDLQHFEMFSRLLPPSWWGGAEASGPLRDAGLVGSAFPGLAEPPIATATAPAWARERGSGVPAGPLAGPEEIDTRIRLAEGLCRARQAPLALVELEKTLLIEPDHLPSRLLLAQFEIEEGRFDAARRDLAVALSQRLRLEGRTRGLPGWLNPLFVITRAYLKAGRPEDARWVVEQAREIALQSGRDVGLAHYHSAEVYAVLAASDPTYLEQAVDQLFRAGVAHPDFLGWYRDPSPWFDPVRIRIDAKLGRREDPAAIHRRFVKQSSSRPEDRVAER